MSRARKYRLQAADYAKQAVHAPAAQRPMFRLLVDSWLELAEREERAARLGEARSFAPGAV
jgi:hypothetical protein